MLEILIFMGSSPTRRDKKMPFRSVNDLSGRQLAQFRGSDMCTEDIMTALHDSAHGAAHLYSEMSEDVPGHAPLLEHFGTAAP